MIGEKAGVLSARSQHFKLYLQHNNLKDAFVAHNHAADIRWVLDKLLPKVEREWQLKLCVGYRDFIPGVPIAENIDDAIDNSRKTILVLTPGFAKSEWCDFEMHMALYRGRTSLVMCYVSDSEVQDMVSTLRGLMRTTNYIEWGKTDIEHERFWQRLQDILISE